MAGTSSADGKASIEEETARRKRELELKIRKQVACEERAFRIVEKLSEGTCTADYLIDCGGLINPGHYADIVEERAIVHLCGYPICPNALGKVLQQKFYISTKSNKVYDITERKNFCSNQCFKASKYFEKQISTTPVWLRGSEQPRLLTILDTSKNIGTIGSEVIGAKPKPIPDLVLDSEPDEEDTSKATTTSSMSTSTAASDKKGDNKSVSWASDQTNDGLTEHFREELKIGDSSTGGKEAEKNSSHITSNKTKSAGELLETQNTQKSESKASSTKSKTEYLMHLLNKRKNLLSTMVDDQPLQPKEEEKNVNDKMISHLKDDAKNLRVIERTATMQNQSVDNFGKYSLVEQGVNTSWQQVVESNSTDPLSASVSFLNSASETKISSSLDESHQSLQTSGNLPPNVLTVYNRLSEWVTIATLYYLNVLEKSGEKGDKSVDKTDSKLQCDKVENATANIDETQQQKQVDFHTIHEQNKDFTIKVREFYKGSFGFKPPESTTTEEDSDDSGRQLVLPPVESVAQIPIRRKIVLQKLVRSMSDVLVPMGLAIQHVGTEVRELVSTFNLTSKNVVMKPAEWKIVSLFLVKMLDKKIPVLQESFSQGTSLSVIENILGKYTLSLKKLDEALQTMYKLKETSTQAKMD